MLTQVLAAVCVASLSAMLASANRMSPYIPPLLILDLKGEAADRDSIAVLEKLQQSLIALTKPVPDTYRGVI